MKDVYKNSLNYKIRRWVILFVAIIQIIYCIFLWLDTGLNQFIVILIITCLSLLGGFERGRTDPLVPHLIWATVHYFFARALFPKGVAIIVIIAEVLILVLGIVFINIQYYKGYPGPWWKQKWNSFYKKRTKKGAKNKK